MKKVISTLFAALIVVSLVAQEKSGNWCGTDQVNNEYAEKHKEAVMASEKKLDELAYNMSGDASYKNFIDDGRPFLIPCVFHVFYKNDSSITEEKVQQFLDGMNKRYRPTEAENDAHKNFIASEYHDVIGVANIQFILAERDPNGKKTRGIKQQQWEYADGSGKDRDEVKYQRQWDPNRYLNFWVVDAIGDFKDKPGQTVLGYAQLPSSFDAGAKATDGVVIRADQINSNSTTGTHEVGHYLGLYHPFQDDGDEVIQGCVTADCHFAGDRICDLAQAKTATWGSCNRSQNTCPLDARPDPVHDYMMYTPDQCHRMFSKEQVVRMRATLLGIRYELASWENIVKTGIDDLSNNNMVYDANVYPNPFSDQFSIVVESNTEQQICITIKDLLGRTVQKDCKKKLVPGSNTLTFSAEEMNLTENGVYVMELKLTDKMIVSKIKYEQ